jgi:DNA-binding CsgD family transcriptional regulator
MAHSCMCGKPPAGRSFAFDALGVIPWSERARQQLRATGETSRLRSPDTLDQLTPQELQIVQMAATGLSNREIGQMLYLSHRTVSSHLYRAFPKLGITSRTKIGNAFRTLFPIRCTRGGPGPMGAGNSCLRKCRPQGQWL